MAAAVAIAIDHFGELDVTLFTPRGAPGVLDDPVFALRWRDRVADHEHAVVEIGAALAVVEDAC